MRGRRHFDPESHYAAQQLPPPADVGHIQRKFLDLPYASLSPAQKLDVYLPESGQGPFPVIISIHGGAFMGCDKSDAQVVPMLRGLERGYAVVAVNYRLSWEAGFPASVHDVKAAVRWIRGNAPRYGFDSDRVAAWGGSAGGYLSAMLGTSAGVPQLEDLALGNPSQPSTVQAVVAWFAPTDFLQMDAQLAESGMAPPPGMRHNEANSPESLMLGAPITQVPELVKAANPETYISPKAPPFFLQHGSKDATVPAQQSVVFAQKLRRAIGEDQVLLEILADAEHADAKFETPGNVAKVMDFLDRHLRRPR
jgi:acetyl esterase/lipase